MAKKELDLLKFAARSAAQPGASSAEVVWGQVGGAGLCGELLDDVPNKLFLLQRRPTVCRRY